MIKFQSKARIFISDELCPPIIEILTQEGAKSVLAVIDSNIAQHEEVQLLHGTLSEGYSLVWEKMIAKEPTTDMVNDFTEKYRSNSFDMVIAVGGGSILDFTKVVSAMLVNPGKVEDYHGTGKQLPRAIKKIMVPTTAGTGSEATAAGVLINTHTHFKRGVVGPHVTPDYAVLNAKLIMKMPDHILASTGMDAMAHAVESYAAVNANVITRMYAKQAFSLIVNSLKKIFSDRSNYKNYEDLMLGSCLAGYAITNSNTGAAHGMSYALGIYKGVPHGVGVGTLLPHVLQINMEKGCSIYGELLDCIEEIKDTSGTKEEKTKMFVEYIQNYEPLKKIPALRTYNIAKEEINFLADKGFDFAVAFKGNPVDFTVEDSIKSLNKAW